jgi:predicted small lipoprotein YifL
MRRIFFALLIIISLAAGLSGCGHKAPPTPPATEKKSNTLA